MNTLQLFNEFDKHLIQDNKPSVYFEGLAENGLLDRDHPFTLLSQLQSIEQSPDFHPEGNVWEHTMLVVDLAAEIKHLSNNPRVFMWAALLHDLGKISTTKMRGGRITAYDHDRHGAKLAREFLRELSSDQELIDGITQLIRWHMQPLYVNKRLPFANVEKMLSQISLEEIALFSLCDRLGRGNMSDAMRRSEIAYVESFVTKCGDIFD